MLVTKFWGTSSSTCGLGPFPVALLSGGRDDAPIPPPALELPQGFLLVPCAFFLYLPVK